MTDEPQTVQEPGRPNLITTTSDEAAAVICKDSEIAPLQELKDLYNEIKRNLDVNLELTAPLEHFNDLISILCARQISMHDPVSDQPDASAQGDSSNTQINGFEEEKKEEEKRDSKPEVEPLNEQEKFIYTEMIPGVASRLVKHTKTANSKFTTLVGESINGLVDLLIVELRK